MFFEVNATCTTDQIHMNTLHVKTDEKSIQSYLFRGQDQQYVTQLNL